ncbi:MAG TPA: glycerol-3-phosphate dehydrogenase/oxidase [Gemmatimonadales bacterium]|nr:glycerol-3-phosphate dehydrogenase/oxidase [Gemmatimonadales bacterium]
MDASFSLTARRANLAAMTAESVDLLVIGGGITGAGIARDAAMRGMRTALVDKDDFGSGTSSRSSRLVHGGLRYLETGDLKLVFEASRERRVLLNIAPHLVWPRSFIFPVHSGSRVPRWKLSAGLWLYDALALFRNVKRHESLSKKALLRAEPAIRSNDLSGGARYWDAQCDDVRLVLGNVRDAYRHGAYPANYVRVDAFERVDGRVTGARMTDRLTGETLTVHAHVVVNATGPWSDALRQDGTRLLHPTKGVHVLVPRARLGNHEAVTLTSPIDGRVMFILPWSHDLSYIGTTDTECDESPDDLRATADDVIYLLRSANAFYPSARLQPDDVISAWAGLRPLLRPRDPTEPGKVSREHQIVEHDGLLSIVGGKLTTYRVMAEQMVNRVAEHLRALDGRDPFPPCRTAEEPLPGGEARDLAVLIDALTEEGTDRALAEHLVRSYGGEAPAVARLAESDPALGARITPQHPALRAELIHAIRREMALTLTDLLLRRTHVFLETPGHGLKQAPEIVDLIADELGWDAARKASELAAYLQEVERHESFRTELAARA